MCVCVWGGRGSQPHASARPISHICPCTCVLASDTRQGGLEIHNYKTTLPLNKGLSSSAALCVLVARAFNRVYDLKLSVRGEMDIAYQGEITTPSQCGRMDQCCAFGTRPVLMKFDGDLLECEELTVGAPLYLVIVELQGTPRAIRRTSARNSV